jgi:elongation factor P hydroxylase
MNTNDRDGCVTDSAAVMIAGRFNRIFGRSHRVRLIGGAIEPEYLPPTPKYSGSIRYRSNFAASALHEIAHWCIAGPGRRRLVDYGYWYQPPPRDPGAQRAFARVEAKVQALEAIFSQAAGLAFRVSIDDVENLLELESTFRDVVAREAVQWRQRGLPARAELFRRALGSVAASDRWPSSAAEPLQVING